MINCKNDLLNTYIVNDKGELRDLYLSKADEFGVKWYGGGIATEYMSGSPIILIDNDIELLTCSKVKAGFKQLTLAYFKPSDTEMEAFNDEYSKGMYNCVCAVAKAVGYKFGVDVGFDNLPDKVNAVLSGLTATIDQLVPIEQPKTKTKVEYVKCEESLNDIAKAMIDGEILHSFDGGYICKWGGYEFVDGNGDHGPLMGAFYRKVETEITWQDELDDFLKLNNIHSSERISMIPCDKFIEMCHLVSNANK